MSPALRRDPFACVVLAAGAGERLGRPDALATVPSGERLLDLVVRLAQLLNLPALGALLWPVDHPFVRLESVLAVVDAFKRTRAPIVIPTFKGRRGYPALFARETWHQLTVVEGAGMSAVVHDYGARVVELSVPDAGIVRDVDTSGDLPRGDWRTTDALS